MLTSGKLPLPLDVAMVFLRDIALLIFHVGCQIGFMILLCLCYFKGWFGGSTTRPKRTLSRLTIQTIKKAFVDKRELIDHLVTQTIISQLKDGK